MPCMRRFLVLVSFILALTVAHSEAADKGTVVTVDCSKGAGITAALSAKGDPLTVEVRGLCTEDVVINRDNVTLHGLDPFQDGIQGVAPDSPAHAVLRIDKARNVRIENLLITGGSRNGIGIGLTNFTRVSNCRVVGNARFGITVSNDAVALISDTTIGSGIEPFGVGIFSGDLVTCRRCIVSVAGLAIAVNASRLVIEDSTLAGSDGIVQEDSEGTAQIKVINSTISAVSRALGAWDKSVFVVQGGTLRGSVSVDMGSLITLDNTRQLDNPGTNYVGTDSNLRAVNDTFLLGSVAVKDFGNLVLLDTSSIQGSLTCTSGGDAFCASPSAVSDGTSGCALCIASP